MLSVPGNGGKWRPTAVDVSRFARRFFPSIASYFHEPDGRQNQKRIDKIKRCAFPPPQNFLAYSTRDSNQKSRFLVQGSKREENHSVASPAVAQQELMRDLAFPDSARLERRPRNVPMLGMHRGRRSNIP